MNTFMASALAALLLAGAAPAQAHDDAAIAHLKPPNGGQLRAAGEVHLELVVAATGAGPATPVTVYVSDHAGTGVATAGASATVTLLSGATKTTITLRPAGDNRLAGSGNYKTDAGMKAVVSVTLPGKAPATARFTPLAKPGPK